MIVTKAKNLLELAESERLTTFIELVKIGGVEEAFSKFGAYTIFIPSEAAFYCMPRLIHLSLWKNETNFLFSFMD